MGTSFSGGGPVDKIPLLPVWALTGGGDGGNSIHADVPQDGESGGAESAKDPNNGSEQSDQPPAAAPSPAYWSAAKRRLGVVASHSGGRARIARAGRAYVKARGGAKKAASSATSARGATARLGGFLSNVSNLGVRQALDSLGLGRFIGRNAHEVFAAIVDALAPEGTNLEQSATRLAIEQTLAGLFEEYVAPDGDVTALEAMTPDSIRLAIEASVAASIFNRWLVDLERKLEEKAMTPAQAVKLERDMDAYIRDTVKLDLKDIDPLKMRWDAAEGATFIEQIYQEAYSILGR